MQRRLLVAGVLALGALGAWIGLGGERPSRAPAALAPEGAGERAERARALEAFATDESTEESTPARAGETVPLRGSVLELPGARAMSGVALRVVSGGDVLVETQSDEAGDFAFVCERRADLRIEPIAPATHWACEPSIEIDLRDARPAPLRVALVPLDRARFQGVVVDADTGERVPRIELRVFDDEGGYEDVRSDDEGRFATEGFLRSGELRVSIDLASGDRPLRAETLHDHRAARGRSAEAVVRAHVGPTYRLRIEAPPGVGIDALRAFLIDSSPPGGPPPHERMARIEAGDPPWVRFEPLPVWYESTSTELVLRTHDGRLAGRASVPGGGGVQQSPVDIRLEALATLRGTVRDEAGESVGSARVQLVRLDGATARELGASSAGNGLFTLKGVPPGRYALSVLHAYSGACELTLDLNPGELRELELRLEPYEVGGDVEGTLRSTTGAFRGAASVFLGELGDGERALQRRAAIEWSDEGVGRFRFEAVPRGKYALAASIGGAPHRIDPEVVETSPPATVDFVVRDDFEVFRMRVSVVDAESDDDVEGAELSIWGEGDALEYDGPLDDWPAGRKLAAHHPLRWRVRAAGYEEARGDRSAVKFVPGGYHWRLRVELRHAD